MSVDYKCRQIYNDVIHDVTKTEEAWKNYQICYIPFSYVHMLRKDVFVKRPEGTKIYRQRNCVYVYHVVGSEYKKDKKYVVEKRVCIGKMVDDENMNTKAEGVEMAEFGHAKDDSSIPQVNISYAVNHTDATPLFYGLYPVF